MPKSLAPLLRNGYRFMKALALEGPSAMAVDITLHRLVVVCIPLILLPPTTLITSSQSIVLFEI